MSYFINKKTDLGFEQAILNITEKLNEEGFGIMSTIDVKNKLNEKLGVEFRNYMILGACNPSYALRALQIEPFLGTMMPCNVVVQEWEVGSVEVASIDPLVALNVVENKDLIPIAEDIREKLKRAIDAL